MRVCLSVCRATGCFCLSGVSRASPPDAIPEQTRALAETAFADLRQYSSSLGGRGLELVLAAFGLEPTSGGVTPVGATLGLVKLTTRDRDSAQPSLLEAAVGEAGAADDAESHRQLGVTAETVLAHGDTIPLSVVRRAVHTRDLPGTVVLLTLVTLSVAFNDVIEARLANIASTLSVEA